MSRRRWLPAVAVAALASSSLLACIVSLDDGAGADGGADGSSDATADAGAGGDAAAEASPPVSYGACRWDGASPSEIVLTGFSTSDGLHVRIAQGSGPPFHVRVYDNGVDTRLGDADLRYFDICATQVDDDGSTYKWDFADGMPNARFDFHYELLIETADGAVDEHWPYRPTIDVQALEPDGSGTDRSDATATCFTNEAGCYQAKLD